MSNKQRRSIAFIAQHPSDFALSSLKRTLFFWITAPDEYWLLRGRNFYRPCLFSAVTLTGFAGLYLAGRKRLRGALLLGGVLFFYPLVYYFTHVESRYSHPLAPLMVMLIMYTISKAYQAFAGRLHARV
jgi:hypothetical protein